MKIFLAHSDRDFLQSMKKRLELERYEVCTAFDGTQVASFLVNDSCDIMVTEDLLPRFGGDRLIGLIRLKKLPVIVIPDCRITMQHLLRDELPNAYLPLPFLPDELMELIENVSEKTKQTENLSVFGLSINVAGFCFADTEVRLTAGEIDFLKALEAGQAGDEKRLRPIVHALNEKLARLGQAEGTIRNSIDIVKSTGSSDKNTGAIRISYKPGKGYEMVESHE